MNSGGLSAAIKSGPRRVEIDFERDARTLRSVSERIRALADDMRAARAWMGVRQRGYFEPDEDHAAKRLFHAYLRYRAALYDIVHRWEGGVGEGDDPESTRSFLLAFGAALKLYHWSGLLIAEYKDVPEIADKLNEPDPALGLKANAFEEIHRLLTRVDNQSRLAEAAAFFESHRARLSRHAGDPFAWLIDDIARDAASVKKTRAEIWTTRLERDLDLAPRRMARPFAEAAYRVRQWALDLFGGLW